MPPLPVDVPVGAVVGRFGAVDGIDLHAPDDTVIRFIPTKTTIVSTAEPPVRLALVPAVCSLDTDGYLCGPSGGRGVTLVATDDQWCYSVTCSPPLFGTFRLHVPAGAVVDIARLQ